ncbi:TIGR03773 family transporter-associated surface protein [Cellulomonas pakistanensis]|uniref:ABC transporter-associated repeat protein n=1 Tax=Cellulomonas pakistanensis TaxID=992287 RepID=A0A919PEZ3_9CELL|nr:TIGR03773 family transporter-associated surface protein [Cellulomonas pakistanensis]GIG36947.1 hypothetical protein Cpa01nite_23280 [Cellulomonas pakistanensis]
MPHDRALARPPRRRHARRAVAAALSTALLAAGAVAGAATAGAVAGAAPTEISSGAYLVRTGVVDGALRTGLAQSTGTWLEDPGPVVLRVVGDEHAVPDDPAYSWLGDAGATGWSTYPDPQRPAAGGLALGLDTGGVEAADLSAADPSLTVSLADVRAPGDVLWYRVAGDPVSAPAPYAPGTPALGTGTAPDGRDRAASTDIGPGYTQGATMSMRFTAEGMYCLDVQTSATLAGAGTASTSSQPLRIAVGPTIPADAACGSAPDAGGTDPAPGGDPTDPAEPADPADPADPTDPTDPAEGGWADLPLSGREVLSVGHMDVLSTVTASSLHVDVHDDTTTPATAHEVEDATFYAAPGSSVTSAHLQQVFGPGVDEAWVLPQAQDFSLVWPGWNVSPSGTRVTWTLDDVRGPGRFALFESGSFGAIRMLLSDSGTPGSFSYDEHGHGSWAFTRQGVYCLDSTFSTGSGADRRADSATLLLAVGDVDPERVTEEMCGKTPEEIVEGDARPGTAPDPVAPSELTGSARGPVRAASSTVTTDGGTVDVFVGTDRAGRWASLWWYSTPRDLGWHRVASDGWVRAVPVAATTAGAHKLAALDRDGDLIGWAPVTVRPASQDPGPAPVPAPDPGPGGPQPGAIPAGTEVCTPTPVTRQVSAADATVATGGHFDFGSQLINGELVARTKDDAGAWRDPAGLVLHVSETARRTVPAGFEFLGSAGSTIWEIPETQEAGIPWLGWNTQHPSVTSGLSGPVTFTLAGVDGPGDLIVYMGGSFGSPNQRVFDTVGGPRSVSVPLNTHQHAHWVFTQPGAYHVTITQTGTTTSGQRVSATGVVHVFVGSGDPRAAAATTTVTEWVGRTASGAECALSADQLASVTGATATAEALTARSAAQVHAAAAVLQADDRHASERDTTIDVDQQATGATPTSVDPAGRGVLAGVLGALATLTLAGAVTTGRAWWRGQTQETTR